MQHTGDKVKQREDQAEDAAGHARALAQHTGAVERALAFAAAIGWIGGNRNRGWPMAHAKYWNAGSTLVLTAAALALAAPAAAQQAPEAVAAEALRRAPVWDGHNDVPGQLRGRHGNVLAEFDFRDTTASGATHPQGRVMQTDLTRLRQGRVGAQFWSVYVPATLPEPQAVQQTIEQIDVTRRLIDRYPADLALALTSNDVARAMRAGRIASLIGMEGCLLYTSDAADE